MNAYYFISLRCLYHISDASRHCPFFIKGPEICNDLKSVGIKLDYYVTGYGAFLSNYDSLEFSD